MSDRIPADYEVFAKKNADGEWKINTLPNWIKADGTKLSVAEWAEHGYHPYEHVYQDDSLETRICKEFATAPTSEWTFEDGVVRCSYVYTDLDIERVRMNVMEEFEKTFESVARFVKGPYCELEQETWSTQVAEVKAWRADPQAATPFMAAVAASRGTDLVDLLTTTGEKIDLYNERMGTALGNRQALVVTIGKLDSVEALVQFVKDLDFNTFLPDEDFSHPESELEEE